MLAARPAEMSAAQIFISYRRDDSAGYARAIGDALAQRFGAERVFMDVDDIGAGHAFDRAIDDAVGGARVLLVLIGRRWLAVPAGATRPRLEEPDDFVRHEVATGLARGLQVIPLLLDGATMPVETDLPEPLRPLARRQALVIDHARYAADVERLVAALRAALGEVAPATGPVAGTRGLAGAAPAPEGRQTDRRRLASALVLGGGVAALVVSTWLWRGRTGEPDDAATGVAPARPAINGRWAAEVAYPWSSQRFIEHFLFEGDGTALHGTAAFLRVDRGIVDGRIAADGELHFATRTQEQSGAALSGLTHRYRGRLIGEELRLVMQTEGGVSPRTPVEITARRVAP